MDTHGPADRTGNLGAACDRRLDRIRIIRRLGANEAQIDDLHRVLGGEPQNGVIEYRKRRRSDPAHWWLEIPVVNRAQCKWEASRDERLEQSAIPALEFVCRIGYPPQDLRAGARAPIEEIEVTQYVVPAGAHHEVRRTARQSLELYRHFADDRAIDGKERGRPPCRKQTAKMRYDVGSTGDVCGVIEDRISEKNDVSHSEK